jgi:uncharacterized protein (DUF697 family)
MLIILGALTKMENNNETSNPETEPTSPADKIIYRHIGYSMIAGAIPLPVLDVIAVTAIQVDMMKQLAELHGADFDKDRGKSVVSALAGATFARMGASALKVIPGVGTVMGAAFQAVFAGASTYALGQLFDSHFSSQSSIFDVDMETLKRKYDEYVEKGKKIAEQLYKEQKSESGLETIEKLHKLKESGAISEEEFEKTKQSILDKMNKK